MKKSKSGRGAKASTLESTGKKKPSTKMEKKKKVKKVMDEWKEGKLKSNGGKVVKDQKQAVAIALSESGQSYKQKKNK